MASIVGRLRKKRRAWQRRKVAGRLPKGKVGVEVGVAKGHHAAMLLRKARPSKLYLVDQWQVVGGKHAKASYGAARVSQAELDGLRAAVEARFADEHRVQIVALSSVEAAASIDEKPDWVYLDADHSYEGVRSDIEAWWPLLDSGGILYGDDYKNDQWWGDGVMRAVDEHVAMHGLDLQVVGTQWWITKP